MQPFPGFSMKNVLVQLHDFDLITVKGVDSAKFLQGQLTCNLERVTDAQSIAGAYCNIKGRVITDFRLFKRDDTYFLQTGHGLGAVLKQTLDKYIVFSKAKTADITGSIRRYGLMGSDAISRLQHQLPELESASGACTQSDELVAICIPGPVPRFEIYELSQDSPSMNALLADFPKHLQEHNEGVREWQLADIRACIAHISNSLQEAYTPQVLNYDLLDMVDFKKGCYTGQEIVARMHYRGEARKRLYHIKTDGAAEQILALTYTLNDVAATADIISSVKTDAGIFELLAILPCDVVVDGIALQIVTGNRAGQHLHASVTKPVLSQIM